MNLLKGHDPLTDLTGFEGEGIDLLLTEYATPGGKVERTLAVRPGLDRRDRTWGPAVDLKPEAGW